MCMKFSKVKFFIFLLFYGKLAEIMNNFGIRNAKWIYKTEREYTICFV